MVDEKLAIDIWNSGSVDYKCWSYVLYHNGILGNKPLTWNSLEEIAQSKWNGKVSIRSKKGIARSKTEFNKTYKQAEQIVKQWTKEGINLADITFNQSMPEEDLALQGEVMMLPGGLYLYGSFVKKPMNLALAEKSFSVQGSPAVYLIQKHLFPASREDMDRLLNQFPDNALEFSAYNTEVGDLPGRNTIFWEVRNY